MYRVCIGIALIAIAVRSPQQLDSSVPISYSIQDGKGVSPFEHTRAIIHQCGGRTDVIFVSDSDNVGQIEAFPKV